MMESLRAADGKLFRALNKLKGNGILYGRQQEDREDYELLVQEEDRVNGFLACDDCCCEINREYQTVRICFLSGEPNRLRVRLTVNQMKVFAACYAIYRERCAEAGYGVATSLSEITETMRARKILITKQNGDAHMGETRKAVLDLRDLSMLTYEDDDTITLLPGLVFAVDKDSLDAYFDTVLKPWLEGGKKDGRSDS